MRQCVCGKSKLYPYCDNSHIRPKVKDLENENQKDNLQD